jgi:tetratricopeptide (TPR) repeat protein
MAWSLVAWEEPRLNDPALALKLAARATQREPRLARAWATVGLAHYRLGDDRSAIVALERALNLGVNEYTPADFVLAMARWRNGELMAARFDYWRGVKRLAGARPENTLLPRFRDEAARTLRLPKDQQ